MRVFERGASMSPELQAAFDRVIEDARALGGAVDEIAAGLDFDMSLAKAQSIRHRLNNHVMVLREKVEREGAASSSPPITDGDKS